MEKLKNLGCINGRPERAAVFVPYAFEQRDIRKPF